MIASIPVRDRKARRIAHERAAVAWLVLLVAGVQVVLAITLERARPDLRDPEFATKAHLLRKALRQHTGRPLVLVLGSSRALNGLRPELLPSYRTSNGKTPVVFNFGLSGYGPVHELVAYRRLSAEGIRPACVLVEVVPTMLCRNPVADDPAFINRQAWGDLSVLARYVTQPLNLYWQWGSARTLPWFSYRFCLLNRYAPTWVPRGARTDFFATGVSDLGWLPCAPTTGKSEDYQQAVARARDEHAAYLEHFRVAPVADRALRELIGLCRRDGIAVGILLMPEGKAFQSWYSADSSALVSGYLRCLTTDHGVPIFGTRNWIAEEGFRDSQHLLSQGAAKFTARFGREILAPLLNRRRGPAPLMDLQAN